MKDLFRIAWVCLFSTACGVHAGKDSVQTSATPIANAPEINPPVDDRPTTDAAVDDAPVEETPKSDLPGDGALASKDEAPAGDSVSVVVRLGETARPGNGLALTLTSFSHKRPMVGGPTKATAYIRISKGAKADEITLSEHGVEGKTEAEDGLSPEDRYDTVEWSGFEIRLTAFSYDELIEVRIRNVRPSVRGTAD